MNADFLNSMQEVGLAPFAREPAEFTHQGVVRTFRSAVSGLKACTTSSRNSPAEDTKLWRPSR